VKAPFRASSDVGAIGRTHLSPKASMINVCDDEDDAEVGPLDCSSSTNDSVSPPANNGKKVWRRTRRRPEWGRRVKRL